MLKVDTRQLQKLERHLETYAKKAVPFAVRNGLNTTAFEARKQWVTELKSTFVLRNTWTERGLRVDKATGRTVANMQSAVGSIRDYMAEQEQGSTQQKRGKHGVPVPMSGASGQGKKSKRTRSVRRANYLSAMTVAKRVGGIRQRRNAVAIALAAKSGGVAYLDMGRRRGLFSVTGRKKGVRLRLLYDLSHATITSKPRPTLANTLHHLAPKLPGIQRDALLAELKRHRILWYGMWGR